MAVYHTAAIGTTRNRASDATSGAGDITQERRIYLFSMLSPWRFCVTRYQCLLGV